MERLPGLFQEPASLVVAFDFFSGVTVKLEGGGHLFLRSILLASACRAAVQLSRDD